jgi:hypothetical protein
MSFVAAPLCLSLLLASASRPAGGEAFDAPGPLGLSADERLDLEVDTEQRYRLVVSDPLAVVPSPGLPPDLEVSRSNNNLAIALHQGRLFLAFRTAPIHFASPDARLVVLSSPDLGRSWSREASFATGRDLREPFLLEVGGRLHLYFVELDARFYRFEALALRRSSRCGPGCWTELETWGGSDEIAWDFKVRGGRAWMTSYRHKRYELAARPVEIHFRASTDGLGWREVGVGPVYSGGATETAFEFDRGGTLWAITRNEDGDATGFGSHVASAEAHALGSWRFPARSDPSKFDSPRLFRHGNDVYLVARRHLGTAFGTRFPRLSGSPRRLLEWASYSLAPKRTAIYRLDRAACRFEPLVDLPSAGDTAFPSIVRLSPNEFLIANYSSAFRHARRSWLWGQLNGTGIYFVRARFEPLPAQGGAPARSGEAVTSVAAAHWPRSWAANGFHDDWPMRESHAGTLAGAAALSAAALLWLRRRQRLRLAPQARRSQARS